jgi:hypothetical protein
MEGMEGCQYPVFGPSRARARVYRALALCVIPRDRTPISANPRVWTPSGPYLGPHLGHDLDHPHGMIQRVCRKAPVALLYTGGRG